MIKAGYIYVPYIPITTKAILFNENRKTVTWQIGKFMRFKLWVRKLFYKTKKLQFK